jgi:murein L,D-transpeptidase YafK
LINTSDQAYARTGDALMLHGTCVTAGCYARTEADVEAIDTVADAALRQGQPTCAVHVFPLRLAQKHFRRFRHAAWLSFWLNVHEGYDLFVT